MSNKTPFPFPKKFPSGGFARVRYPLVARAEPSMSVQEGKQEEIVSDNEKVEARFHAWRSDCNFPG